MDNMNLSKENYEKMVNLVPQLLCISDMKGYFKYVNPVFERTLGYGILEANKLTLYDLIHPEDRELSYKSAKVLQENRYEDSSFEHRYICKDGTYKWISWNVRIQWDEQLIYSVGYDITKRKNAEIELRKTTMKLQEAQQFANIGYWEYNAITRYFSWSDEIFNIFGLKTQEFVPTMEYFLEIVHPDDRSYVLNLLNGSVESNEFEIDLKIIRPDKKIIYTYQKLKCELDENKRITRAYGIVQDITQRKLDEAKLKESEKKYKSLADNVPLGIFSYDKSGNITFINPKVIDILSFPHEEIERPVNIFTSPKLAEYGISDVYKQCIENGNLVTAEKQYISKWGKSVTLRLLITPIKDDNNDVVSAIAILEDFTDRKKLETELYEAKELAEASNKAKSQFLANMSHEIRTPMNGIIGMTDLLFLTDLTHEQSEMAQIIKTSSKLLLNIINDILDLSKIDAEKVQLNPEYLDVLSSMNILSSFFSVLAKEKGLDFKIDIGHDVPKEIIVDRTRLTQVAGNLIGNAIKFTEKGEVIVSLNKVRSIGKKVKLKFSVSDTGIGIKQEDIPKLFNYFTQLENFLTKKFQGTGLGLAISKRLVELMGGEICVESEYGKGSTFYFTYIVDIP